MDGTNLVDALTWAGGLLGATIVLLLPWELWRLHRQGRLDGARWREMLASASPLLPTVVLGGVVTSFITTLFAFAASLAPWKIPTTAGSAALALLAVDFLYYWDHRVAHRNRGYWALAHSVHHSSPSYDQTTGLRVSFVDGFFSPWFYLPAILVGFDPWLVGACFTVILGYQQWLHTEAIGRLSWLDGWLNTPANHRVHHGVQARYQDRNYGAILMVWDRLFGTWTPESEPVRYGLTHPIGSANPLAVHFCEARRLWCDWCTTPRWRDRLRRLWNPPDWQPAAHPTRPSS
jgi:sterol desaturase/sphingolipid hydroxylase (fatty acid hydroxylase superfamily)